MTKQNENIEKINSLFKRWQEASHAYYNNPEDVLMSDIEFDDLQAQLLSFNIPEITEFINKSIEGRQIPKPNNSAIDPDYFAEMISLKKITFDEKKSYLFINELIKFIGMGNLDNCFIAPKLDGHSIRVIVKKSNPEGSVTKTIFTRGGQDVTNYLTNNPDIQAITKPGVYNGELVLPKDMFAKHWADEYENPRNAVGGVMRKNPEHLRYIICTDGVNPLQANFKIWYPLSKIYFNNDYITQVYNQYKNDEYPFQIDGLVIGYKTDVREVKDNYPLNMVALKFPAPTTQTRVIGFEWTQKKTGKLWPMYLLEPVRLDGITVRTANGYNYENVRDLKCGIGSEVVITKSNDIIPVIKKVLTRSNNIEMPTVDYKIEGKHLVAIDMQLSTEYKFVLGMGVLDIEGIGGTISEQVGKLLDYNIVEVFNPMRKPEIRALLGGGKTWDKFATIYDNKVIPLDLLIEMLQFNGCGKVLSKRFAEILTGSTVDTSGIDKTVLLNVCKGDGYQKIQSSIKRLAEFGIKVIKPVQINSDTITYELTGNPPGMTKKEFVERVKQKYPNSAHTTLNKNTTYLIVDSLTSSSSKANKARKYGIELKTYDQFLNE